MVTYNFKKIQVVPPAKDFIDIMLSKTQRKTPTIIHPGYAIHRIRAFYIRKVKFTQVSIHDRLEKIITDFPRLQDIHPFYADLLNVLYDKDHYKLALAQINTAKHLIDALGRDYVRLLKYGDSLYRCKQLKRAGLGRMVTLLKKQKGPFQYLEQVRQHLARLPAIDPSTRSIILCGFPNVGKSSFMNGITRANVDVQPYPFTTKSLFVGHTNYRYLPWQIIDTPGILDHSLENRNVIEMQSITALAHLRACVLFMIDISEHCGYSIKKQVELFNNISPLFSGKPLFVVLTKIDLVKFKDLEKEDKDLLNKLLNDKKIKMIGLSNITKEGLSEVKKNACDLLLSHRVEQKMSKSNPKNLENILSRIHVSKPTKRDEKKRDYVEPQSTTDTDDNMDVEKPKRVTEREKELQLGEKYNMDFKKNYLLKNNEWKYDVIPHFVDGRNISEFVDADIAHKLEKLEQQEQVRLIEEEKVDFTSEDYFVPKETEDKYDRIVDKQIKYRINSHVNKSVNKSKVPRKYRTIPIAALEKELKSRGIKQEILDRAISTTRDQSVARSKSRNRYQSNRVRSVSEARNLKEVEQREEGETFLGKRKRTLSINSRSASIGKHAGIKNPRRQMFAENLARKKMKFLNLQARAGTADRVIHNLMPKHLFSGKRGNGSTDRR